MIKLKTYGQGLVEFALILPLLILLFLGIAEGAHVVQSYITAQFAVREAARYAVSGQPLNSNGDPWTMPPSDRVNFIKDLAIERSKGTAYTRVISDVVEYETYRDDAACDATCAGYLGVRVDWIIYDTAGNALIKGQELGGPGPYEGEDNPGIEGGDVQVSLYHKVQIWDPIYAAIVPNGYLTVNASIVMRNEGGRPITGAPPPFEEGSGGGAGTGGSASKNPVIEVQDGTSHPAGSLVYLRVRFHDPGTTYNIYVDGILVGPVTTDAQGNGIIPYSIPIDKPAGTYTIESQTLAGVQVAVNSLTVTRSIIPAILTNGDVWPLGSLLEYDLVTHAPNTGYTIEMIDGSSTEALPGLMTDPTGNSLSTGSYLIPNDGSMAAGSWVIQSIATSTVVASRTLTLQQGCIIVDQSACGDIVTVPNGVYINILLDKHAYSRPYILKFDGVTIDANVLTDGNGQAVRVYQIPLTQPDGTYTLTTEDANNPGFVIASTDIVVNTPNTPFIYVDGGYKWPAGTTITFQLRKHTPNTQYDIFWEDTLIISNAQPTDGSGTATLQYTIPVDTPQGFNYNLQSKPHPATAPGPYTAISPDIEVVPQPYLKIPEGSPQVPGATVTVELHNHNINSPYDVYVEEPGLAAPGRALPSLPVITDGTGQGSIRYDIPANLPVGNVITITSYLQSQSPFSATAQTTLELLAADLQVVSIVAPAEPVFNSDVPLTVTVVNAAPVTITHKSFDVDLYIDPTTPPNLGRALPPGDFKTWLQPPMAYSETRTFTVTVPIYGANDHVVYARADTSDRVEEGLLENNNLNSVVVLANTCELQYTASIFDPANVVAYGDAAPPDVLRQDPRIRLTSAGGNTAVTDDTAAGNGHYFVYRPMTTTNSVVIPTINFNDYTVGTYDSSQDAGNYQIQDGGATLKITGNAWKKIDYPYNVTANTVIEFDFMSTQQGEIQGIGLDNNTSISSNFTFEVYGTQTWGLQDYHNYSGSTWKHYVIPAGQFYTGAMNYLFFAGDDDANAAQVSFFRNVKVYESTVRVPGGTRAPAAGATKLVVGTLNNVGNGWQTVTLPNTYNSMVVVATANYDKNMKPAVTRIRNAGGNSFQIRVQNPNKNDPDVALSGYTVHYMVVEEGVYTLAADGVKMEAHRMTSTKTARKGKWNKMQAQTYSQSYASPVVVGQVMSYNNKDWSVFWASDGSQTNPPTSSKLSVSKHIGADKNKKRKKDETIGYIVIEAGTGQFEGMEYAAQVGGDTVRGMGNNPPYAYGLSGPATASMAIASSAAMDDNDGGWPALYGANPVNASTLNLSYDEDQIADSERKHSTEQVAYLVFGPAGAPAPEVNVTGNGVDIPSGSTTPSVTDDTDFGSAQVGSGSVAHTFTVQNLGGNDLTVSNVTLSGVNAADFTVQAQPASPVTGGNSTTFVIVFSPSAAGDRLAQVSFTTNDADEGTYTFAIKGTGTQPSVPSSSFEIQARLLATDTNVIGEWGLEIRTDATTPDAAKLTLGYANGNLQSVWRPAGGTATTTVLQSGVSHPGNTPVWVRIVKTDVKMVLYTAADNGDGTHGTWANQQTLTINDLQGDVLAGMYSSSGNGSVQDFDFDNFKMCNANSNCTGASNILYEAPTGAAQPITAEMSHVALGDAGLQPFEFKIVTVESTPPSPTFAVNGDVIMMDNDGSSTFVNDDANGGFQYAYHPISGNFDVRVRNLTQGNYDDGSALSVWAKFGLEVRAGAASSDDKLDWLSTKSHGLQYQLRQNGSRIAEASDINAGGHSLPVWLRIVRSGQDFTLYYSYDTTNPPTTWSQQTTLTANNMPGTVLLGLLNSSYDANKRNTVTFDGYHVCVNPGATASCGEVREVDGNVFVNANNYTGKIDRTRVWEATSQGGKSGLWVQDGGSPNNYTSAGYNTQSPEVRYHVNISHPGRYYVWALGASPNNSGNSLYVGLSSSPPAADYMNSGTTDGSMVWFNTKQGGSPYFIDINGLGSQSISVWMREDGFELYQLLLTTDPNFTPSTNQEYAQSPCSAAAVSQIPPGMTQCDSGIVNGNFEDDTLMSKWIFAGNLEQVTRTSLPHYFAAGESFSMLLPASTLFGLPRHPWLYQEFTMPTWVLTPTVGGGTSLELKTHVAINPEGVAEPDPLHVLLRDQTGVANDTLSVTGPITMATGGDTPTIDPQNPDPNNSDWILKKIDLAQYFNPVNYAGQTMRLFIESPNPSDTYSTRFYVDNVSLEMCTQQPVPTEFSTKVAGNVRVFIDGVPTEKPGVFVWVYAIDGSMEKSYTIQDSTFSFYGLPADPSGTQYILYAEYTENNATYIASTVIVLQPGDNINNISLLLLN